MGSLLTILILWWLLAGRNNPKSYKGVTQNFGKIIFAIIGLGAIAWVLNFGFWIVLSVLGMILLFGGIGIAILVALCFKWAIDGEKNAAKKTSEIDQQAYQDLKQIRKEHKAKGVLGKLPRSVAKRRRIIEKFNKKFGLNLQPDEIDLINDSSYMSYPWEKEVYDMTGNYSTTFEWYRSDTAWLRAYLKAFPIQNVTSDFRRQQQIVFETVKEIFENVPPEEYGSIQEFIGAVNNRYFASFDDQSIMIMARFLECYGIKHKMPRGYVVSNESELDKLMKKYKDMQVETPETSTNTSNNNSIPEAGKTGSRLRRL